MKITTDGIGKCISRHNRVKRIPAKLESLIGREKDITSLLDYLTDEHDRLVNVVGLRGVGKSSFVRYSLHYVAERKMFTKGILTIQLKDTKNCIGMLKIIMREIMKLINIDRETQKTYMVEKCTQFLMMEYFCSFFNGE